jgi:hypothetical protein
MFVRTVDELPHAGKCDGRPWDGSLAGEVMEKLEKREKNLSETRICPHCGKFIKGPWAQLKLSRHINKDHEKVPKCKCNMCPLTFLYESQLRKHKEVDHGQFMIYFPSSGQFLLQISA